MRIVISGTILALTAALTAAVPATADESLPPPIEAPQVDELAVPVAPATSRRSVGPGDDDAEDLVAELPGRSTGDYSIVGVTWDPGYDDEGLEVQVRSRTEGSWTAWEELHVDPDDAGGRPGTEPWWVDDADGVAVRVTSPTGVRPAGLAVSTIDTGDDTSAATASPAVDVQQAADGSPGYTSRPAIIRRSSWGARANTSCDSPRSSNETRGVVVHHTAGSNGYTKAQSASIVRGVQSYHMSSRDWCDIGYNFLVDKYGQIFEGRTGGIDVPVRGAHAGDTAVNQYTMGVSMMGTYTSSEPTAATKDAMVKLIGWRLGTTYHPATGKVSIGGTSYNRISGHRDVVGTACPGAKAYAWLGRDGGLRDRVSSYISGYTSASRTRVMEMGLSRIGPVTIGEYGFAGSGRKVRLVAGDVYSSPAGGVQYVGSTIRAEYAHFSSQVGPFGVPVTGLRTTANPAVTVQQFENGSIWQARRSGRSTSYGIWGPLDTRYRELGGPASSLGSPVRRYASLGDGRYRAYFSRGTLTREKDGTFTVALT